MARILSWAGRQASRLRASLGKKPRELNRAELEVLEKMAPHRSGIQFFGNIPQRSRARRLMEKAGELRLRFGNWAGKKLRGRQWRRGEKPGPELPYLRSPQKSNYKLLKIYKAEFWRKYQKLNKETLQQRAYDIGIQFDEYITFGRTMAESGTSGGIVSAALAEARDNIGAMAGYGQRAAIAFLRGGNENQRKQSMVELAAYDFMKNKGLFENPKSEGKPKWQIRRIMRRKRAFNKRLYDNLIKEGNEKISKGEI